jgi:hypothetical protein
VLAAESVVVPGPIRLTDPEPEIFPANVAASERLNASPALLVTSPTIEPVAPPLPSCSVPAEIVVPPV